MGGRILAKDAACDKARRTGPSARPRDFLTPIRIGAQGCMMVKRRISIADFRWRRWQWLAVAAMLCLVLAPVLSTAALAATFGPPAAVAAGHVHGSPGAPHHHQHTAAAQKAAIPGHAKHAATDCADGCCLGKGCALCGLNLPDQGLSLSWPGSGPFIDLLIPVTIGIVPPPPSEPPRA